MKTRLLLCLPALIAVSACDRAEQPTPPKPTAPAVDTSLQFPDAGGAAHAAFQENEALRAQVALDRLGFSPGIIDGREGQSYALALKGFQEARGIPVSGELDPATQQALLAAQPVSATRLVTIPEAFARGPFYPRLPRDEAEMATFSHLGYRSMIEALAERFHTSPEALHALNGAGTIVAAGRTIRVPDIASVDPATLIKDEPQDWGDTLQRLGVAPEQPQAEKLVVDKSEGWLRAYDEAGTIIAQFPVTMGSSQDPLPLGTWKVLGEARNPDYQYNPDLFWDAGKNDKAVRLPPGPNGPVGVVWIDLSKDHYGLHGTPEPQNIGRTESHGCVRLTNWDAARLAQMVKPGVTVVFQG